MWNRAGLGILILLSGICPGQTTTTTNAPTAAPTTPPPAQYQLIRVRYRVVDLDGRPLENASISARLDADSSRKPPDRVIKVKAGEDEFAYTQDDSGFPVFSNAQHVNAEGLAEVPIIVYANRTSPSITIFRRCTKKPTGTYCLGRPQTCLLTAGYRRHPEPARQRTAPSADLGVPDRADRLDRHFHHGAAAVFPGRLSAPAGRPQVHRFEPRAMLVGRAVCVFAGARAGLLVGTAAYLQCLDVSDPAGGDLAGAPADDGNSAARGSLGPPLRGGNQCLTGF